jgi:glycerol-3-phosphate dehydrogenase
VPSAFPPNHREATLARLRSGKPLDVLIVGGGINGAGIARDLALRARDAGVPCETALIDKAHFSSGTSGRNSQLIHGGLRYLKYFEFALVKEALHERATLVKIAPHLVEPLPMILPFYGGLLHGLWNRLFYGTGLAFYDLLAGSVNIAKRRFLSRAEAHRLEPGLATDGLFSAAVFYDCRVHSARLLLENLFDAAQWGVACANYVSAAAWQRTDSGYTVPLRDEFTGETFSVQTRLIVDARGPWEGSANIRLVRGSHIIVPRVNQSDNAIAYFGPDGRIIFVIPWGAHRELSLVGTTDVDHKGSPDNVEISAEEVAYLRATLARLFPETGEAEPVAAYSSLRPLVASGTSATAASRSHKIWIEDGILKITGGKYTTYRTMAAEAVDLLKPEWAGRSRTGQVKLGGDTPAVLGGVTPPEIDRAVNQEMARRLSDLVYISTYWGHERLLTTDLLRPVAGEMARQLGWDQARIEAEIKDTLAKARMP